METVELCFICNIKTDEENRNLNEILSQHTNTRLIDLLQNILGDFKSKRTIENNSICHDCLNRINEFDWLCVMVKKQEQELRDLFLQTESIYEAKLDEFSNFEDTEQKIDIGIPEIQDELIEDLEVGRKTRSRNNLRQQIHSPNESDDSTDQDTDNEWNDADDMSDEEYIPKTHAKPTLPASLSNQMTSTRDEVAEDDSEPIKNKNPSKSTNKMNYKCLKCEHTFQKKVDFMKHSRLHRREEKEKTLQCNICTFHLNDQQSYDDHMKQHENKSSPFECVFCSNVMSSKGVLARHMRIHTGIPSHICEICGKTFIHPRTFETHMKFHFNVREHKCPMCPLSFVVSSHLRKHLQRHENDKPFRCSTCGNKFKYLGNLRAHEKLHAGTDKIFKCSYEICDAKFTRRSKMIQHIERQH